jgi:flagellar biosynthetic protein FlhB
VAEDEESKKYDATPKRREEYRKQGKFARSRDAGAVLTIAGAGVVIAGMRGGMTAALERAFAATLGDVTAMTRGDFAGVRAASLGALAVLAVPPLVGAAIAALVSGTAQAGLSPNLDLVGLKLERLDPIPRLMDMLSPKKALKEVSLSLLKVGLVGYVAYSAIKAELPELLTLAAVDGRSSGEVAIASMGRLALKVLGATAIVAAIDYAQSRFTLEQEMKMTLKELKDEMRQEDGDPKVKARMRQRARALAKKRMMADVKDAAVVVTNPTHVSVAIRYADDDPAPMVVAKGHDEVALAIRKEARAHGVPILENRRLARLLDAEIAVGKPIKVEHFTAVARVLAFVFRKYGRRKVAPQRKRRASLAR